MTRPTENIVVVTIRLTPEFERIDSIVELGLITPISIAAMDHVLYDTFSELSESIAERIKITNLNKNPN